jgi:hypothetical protein
LCAWNLCQTPINYKCIHFCYNVPCLVFFFIFFFAIAILFWLFHLCSYFEDKSYGNSSFTLFVQDCFGYLQPFVFPHEFYDFLFFCNIGHHNFDRNCTKSRN